jgi:hypothetical protein
LSKIRLLAELGAAWSTYQDKAFRNLNCKSLQCDEMWDFVGCKQNRPTTAQSPFATLA